MVYLAKDFRSRIESNTDVSFLFALSVFFSIRDQVLSRLRPALRPAAHQLSGGELGMGSKAEGSGEPFWVFV